MAPLARKLRYWSMRHPRPARIKATCGTEIKMVEIEPRASWARVGETLATLEADLLEALDPKGSILRAVRPGDLDVDDDDETDDDTEAAPAPRAEAFDPETHRFSLFAQLIGDAYRQAAEQTGVRNDQAFNRMVDLFEVVNERTRATEVALDRANALIGKLYNEQIKNALARAGDGGGGERGMLEEMIEAFMSGKGNGAAKPDDEPEEEAEEDEPAPNGAAGKDH
jgi:hypothetical protein